MYGPGLSLHLFCSMNRSIQYQPLLLLFVQSYITFLFVTTQYLFLFSSVSLSRPSLSLINLSHLICSRETLRCTLSLRLTSLLRSTHFYLPLKVRFSCRLRFFDSVFVTTVQTLCSFRHIGLVLFASALISVTLFFSFVPGQRIHPGRLWSFL